MINPFDTYLFEHPDFSEEDRMQEINRLFQRQRAVQCLLDGILPPDVLLDVLQEHGIDAANYVEGIAGALQL
ncbi:MAG TPA: hypothetical protein V6D11_12395 [Waterburya sp.]|jgi:hypothetical protein